MSGIDTKDYSTTSYAVDPQSPAYSDKPFHDHLPVMLPQPDPEQDLVTLFEALAKQDKNGDGLSFIEIARYMFDLKAQKKNLEQEIEDISSSLYPMPYEVRPIGLIYDIPLRETAERLKGVEEQLSQINHFINGGASQTTLTDLLTFIRKNDSDGDRKLSESELFAGLSENLSEENEDTGYWIQNLGYPEEENDFLIPELRLPINVPLPTHIPHETADETYGTKIPDDNFTDYIKR